MKLKIILTFFLSYAFLSIDAESKRYVRNHYLNGILKSEGWEEEHKKEGFWRFYNYSKKLSAKGHFKDDKKNGYWYFYSKEGILIKEGHYFNDKKTNWWLFYDTKGQIDHKCQLNNGIKDGYCLQYKDQELISALKYKDGTKIKEWTDFKTFRKENNLLHLK